MRSFPSKAEHRLGSEQMVPLIIIVASLQEGLKATLLLRIHTPAWSLSTLNIAV